MLGDLGVVKTHNFALENTKDNGITTTVCTHEIWSLRSAQKKRASVLKPPLLRLPFCCDLTLITIPATLGAVVVPIVGMILRVVTRYL